MTLGDLSHIVQSKYFCNVCIVNLVSRHQVSSDSSEDLKKRMEVEVPGGGKVCRKCWWDAHEIAEKRTKEADGHQPKMPH